MKRLVTLMAIEAPLVLLIVFSSFGPSEWPTSVAPYLAAMIVIGPIMVVVTDRLFRRRP